MNWARGKDSDGNADDYFLTAPGWNICRIIIGTKSIYELWKLDHKEECIASIKAWNEVEGKRAVKHLKAVAELA